MIPKTIHYCWFGNNPKPRLVKKCIKSWKKYCSDYEIIEWNENNFDLNSAPLYVRQAYEAKKWAFVSDYVRLWALYNYGGIYMDTDVEVIKPLDVFLHHQAFSGFESKEYVSTGIMACEKKFFLFKEFLNEYAEITFIKADGSYDLTTNVLRITNKCISYGLLTDGTKQNIENFVLYPVEYFCPKSYETGKIIKTNNTYTIHHFDGSWLDEKEKKKHKKILFRKRIKRLIGEKKYFKLKSLFRKNKTLN